MNIIFVKPGSKAVYATVNGAMDAKVLETRSFNIDWMYVAPDDCEVRITRGGTTSVKKAEKGDIILQFYDGKTTKELVAVIKNKDWKANVIAQDAEKAAAQAKLEFNAASYKCCDCESCNCLG